MAMKETADAEKALKHLNPDGKEDLCPKTKHHPKEPMKLNSIPSEDQSKAEPSQSSKPKPASVIPAKKRSVLRMMFDRIGQWFRPASASARASETTSNANKVISNHVYPSP
ncbi:unnamed protein product [Prunus armeniaca]|uniref:Uncharacterized protein n=1 Tax=Prunus armeniaca TaxID=36596 RepID=A0A6J5VSG8_PRUAR|nr:unnamed protein product [Prunus armeniaca]CAB4321633.1 unnamed protein product [Prunus armeniaca]